MATRRRLQETLRGNFFRKGRELAMSFFLIVLIGIIGTFWIGDRKVDFLDEMEAANKARKQGDLEEQITILTSILEERKESLGEDHLAVARLSSRLAYVLAQTYSSIEDASKIQENHSAASKVLDNAIEIFKRQLGDDDWETGKAIGQKGYLIGEYRMSLNELPSQRAIFLMQEGLSIVQSELGKGDSQTMLMNSLLAGLSFHQGMYDQAEKSYQETLPWVAKSSGSPSSRLAWHLVALSDTQLLADKFSKSYEQAELAQEIYIQLSSEGSSEFATLKYKKGLIALLSGDRGLAKKNLEAAHILFASLSDKAREFSWPEQDLGFVSLLAEAPNSTDISPHLTAYLRLLDQRYSYLLSQPIRERKLNLEIILKIKYLVETELKKIQRKM